jgi:hypothetical protein
MRSLRMAVGTLVTAACILTASMAGTLNTAHATTGPSQNLKPTFRVSSKFGQQFVGQYILKSIPSAARVQSAALGIEVNDSGFLYGIGQFYGYDRAGSQSSWTATLYHFHQTGKLQMTLELLAPASQTTVLGRLVVAPPQHSTLTGKIVLSGHTYPVVFHRISTR